MLNDYQVIRSRPFLREVYRDFYRRMAAAIGIPDGARVLELGSGGGCIRDVIPSAWRSDIRPGPELDVICSAYALPLADNWLDAIVMLNVFHHLERPYQFLAEVRRCLRPGGTVVMIDPTNSGFARLVWRFHHEAFDPRALHGSSLPNQALAWIVLVNQSDAFAQRCPGLRIKRVDRFSCLAYIASGGLRHATPLPAVLYRPLDWLDKRLGSHLALMQTAVLEKLP